MGQQIPVLTLDTSNQTANGQAVGNGLATKGAVRISRPTFVSGSHESSTASNLARSAQLGDQNHLVPPGHGGSSWSSGVPTQSFAGTSQGEDGALYPTNNRSKIALGGTVGGFGHRLTPSGYVLEGMETTTPSICHGLDHEVIAIIGPKGGVGKTTLAANLAACYEERAVGIVDADVNFANMACMLRFQPERTWGDWQFDQSAFVNANCVRDHIYMISRSPDKREIPSVQQMRNVIQAMRRDMALTLIDCGSDQSEYVEVACQMATKIVVVTTPDQVSLRNAMDLLNRIQPKVPVEICMNRAVRFMPYKLSDLEKELGYPVKLVLPDERKVTTLAWQGKLMVEEKKRSTWSRRVRAYAESHDAQTVKRGILAKLFG